MQSLFCREPLGPARPPLVGAVRRAPSVRTGEVGELVPLTHRSESLAPDGTRAAVRDLGIDRISTVLPVHRAADALRRDRHRQVPIGGAAARLELRGRPGGERIRIDVNPARVLDPSNFGPLPAYSLSEAYQAVVDALDLPSLVHPVRPFQEGSLTGIHVARDLEHVDHLQPIFWSLLRLPRRVGGRARAYFDRDGHIEGIQVGGARQHRVLYDKTEQLRREHGAIVAGGRLRFEVRAGAEWLLRAELRTLQDLTPSAVLAFARRHWEQALFGTEVMAFPGIAQRVEATDWRDVTKSSFLGDLHRLSEGIALQSSNDRKAKFFRQLRELGMPAVVPLTEPVDSAFSTRLDFDTGRELAGGGTTRYESWRET